MDAGHTREVAGIVARNLFIHGSSGLESSGSHQLGKKLRVMRYFVLAVKLRG